MKVAEVYLNQTNKRIDHPYDYLIPESFAAQLVSGMRVTVGFGRGKRRLEAFVIRIKDHTDFPDKIRPILSIIDGAPVLTEAQIRLCCFMKERYGALFYEALGNFVNPVKVLKKKGRPEEGTVFEAYAQTEKVYHLINDEKLRGSVQKKVIEMLSVRDCTRQELMSLGGDISAVLRRLEARGIIESRLRESCHHANQDIQHKKTALPSETDGSLYKQYQQKEIFKQPYVALSEADFKMRYAFYIRLIHDRLDCGQSTVLLLPEIAWSLEIEQTFYQYFGDQAAVCHGRQSQKERYDVFKRVQCGEVKAVVGSRAALFLPYRDLGLIIVDEEQDSSYYAAAMPRYHTIDLAEKYAALTGAQLIASDEIPSVSLLYKMEQGRYASLGGFDRRLFAKEPIVVDLQREMKSGNYDFISRALKESLEEHLNQGKRVALMLNKRGYASYVFCRNCGHVEKCPVCKIPLKSYKGILRCHYCGYSRQETHQCPQCGQYKMKALGLGIDQVYEVLKKRYPQRSILKIDSETIQTYDDFKKMQDRLRVSPPDILLGTRMMIRFPDLGEIALGAAILIDSDLNHGDYRSSEETWQLYGRFFKRIDGICMLQTYEPEDPTVQALSVGESKAFYQNEMAYRRLMKYPPVKHLVMISLVHDNEKIVEEDAVRLYRCIRQKTNGIRSMRLFEPFLSGMVRRTGQIRWKLMIKTDELERFNKMIDSVIKEGGIEDLSAKVSIEIDPPVTL